MTTWIGPDDPGNAQPPLKFSEILAKFFEATPEGPVNEHPGPDFDGISRTREISAEEIDCEPPATANEWLALHATDGHSSGFEPSAPSITEMSITEQEAGS